MNITQYAKTRYTTKAFDGSKKIPAETLEEIRNLLRHAPSSVNSQPWHFVIAGTDLGKARVAKATQPGYAYNEGKILNASHVVVLCARTDFDEAHLSALLEQEDKDGRFATPEAKAGQHTARSFYVNLHRLDLKMRRTGPKSRCIWRWARCCSGPRRWASMLARWKALTGRRSIRSLVSPRRA